MHHFIQNDSWPVTCADCDRWFASPLPSDYPDGCAWLVYDERAIEIVRTSRLATKLPHVTLEHDHHGWVTDLRGLALTIAAHHHTRGLAYNVDDQTWTAVTLLALHDDRGPGLPAAALDGAHLILGTHTRSEQAGPPARRGPALPPSMPPPTDPPEDPRPEEGHLCLRHVRSSIYRQVK